MNRFFINETADEINNITDTEDIKHIQKVLRLQKDDEIEIVDLNAKEYIMKIKDIKKDKIELVNFKEVTAKREADIRITLYQGIPKNPKMEYICQKLTEVGVQKIVPVKMERCVSTDINDNKISRLQKIVQEASKQSKRLIIPQITSPITVDKLIEELKQNDRNILFYEDEKKRNIKDFLENNKYIKTLGIIIGPEGGISQEELEILKDYTDVLTLGNTILRTETAGLVATSILIYEYENIIK
ncbi:hypothetical protein HMPREF9629_00735 [Peptoanaerobacter stomatis]|uniref:Ribosomal RNA small subunit methyltransferase E n=1 Tax=Peptoanaerobacter stomatis TaxID=796937 RepID=G9X2X8_9FIRM|nr:RsmE family RNA methyltransferase [Peptoanaerobacter stomatis]EHL11198.1 hypothetical protein HMPREF9629_00735 [Peptoanaerobacter stomatis]